MAKASIKAGKSAQQNIKANMRKPQEERWAEIIDAATEIFWEKGYDAATLQDIAERVGILKGSIYYYIESKTDLRAHMLQEAHRDGLEMITRIADSESEPLARLYKILVGHVFHVCKHMARTAVFLHEIRRLTAEEKAQIGIDDGAYARVFQKCIEAAQSEDLIRKEIDPKLAGICTLGALNSIYTWYKVDGETTPAQIAEYLASTLLNGLATTKGAKALAKILKTQTP